MIHKIKNTHSVASIFADWKETIIWSCLEGVMGEKYKHRQNQLLTSWSIRFK